MSIYIMKKAKSYFEVLRKNGDRRQETEKAHRLCEERSNP